MRNFVQNTYEFRSSTIGYAGQVSDVSLKNIESFAAEAVIEYGVAVKRGTDKEKQVLPWADANTDNPVVGIAVATYINGPTVLDPTGNRYEIGETVNVLTFGKVLVTAHVDVVAGEAAYVIVAGDDTAGKFTNVALNNLRVGTFKSNAEADNLVELEIK